MLKDLFILTDSAGYLDLFMEKGPDLFINIFGVAIGGLLAFWIARWQIKKQEKNQRVSDMKVLKHKFDRICVELRDNRNTMKNLYEALRKAGPIATEQQWNYFVAIGNSLSLTHYNELIKTGLHNLLPEEIDLELFVSYDHVQDIKNWIVEAANHSFALLSIPNPDIDLGLPLKNLATYTNTSIDHLNYSVDLFYKYKGKMEL